MSTSPSKQMSLADAVTRHVRPGMHLHFASSPSRSNASIREVARRFQGTRPDFTLSATGFHSTAHLLALLRLGTRYISCFFGDNYPTPRPNPLYVELQVEGARLEHWSLLSYVTALRAGALGQTYATTSSLSGTTLGTELARAGRFFELPEPDGSGARVGLVRAMQPDIAFFHAAAGDAAGRFIASPPYGEGFWSAHAARAGVIVTVEKMADRRLLDRSADWIKVPAYRVLAVCEEPFGAHPQPAYIAPRAGLPAGHVDDFEHYELWRRMTGDPALFADFVRRVLTVADGSAGYREFVGEQRLAELLLSARSGRGRTTSIRTAVSKTRKAESDELSPNGRLVLLAARTIVRRVVERSHDAILAGVGVSFAAARVAKLILDDMDRKVEVMVETGLADLECGESAHPFLLAWANMAQAGRLSSVEDVLGTLTCGAYNRCLGVVGAAEIDARGDINSTRLASGELLVGSGGASDIASSCSEVVAVVRCEPARLVPRVHYVTSPGRAIWHIATDRCVLSRSRDGEAWTVGDVYPERSTLAEALASLHTRCRFPELDDAGSSWAEPPTPLELEALAVVGERHEPKAGIHRRAGGA